MNYKKQMNEAQKIQRLGEANYNNQGCLMKIIKYDSSNNVIVEFQDNYKYKKKTTYKCFIDGNIKNLYYPTVNGIGILGNKYPSRINGNITIEYNCWVGMIRRCYDKKMLEKEPTYIPCVICDDWLLFDNFYEWLHKQENYTLLSSLNNIQLDKDIIHKHNKVYSPENCCLVPNNINMLLVKANSIRGDFPIGVRKNNNDEKYDAYYSYNNKTLHIGHYNTINEAFNNYKIKKECLIKKIAKKEYENHTITKKCYEALISYKVEITD